MWRISRRNSIIKWQGYRVSASRLAESNFRYAQDSEHADFDAAVNVAHNDQETEVVPPAQEPEEMPLPSDPKVIFLGGLFVLALLATAYVASEIVLPLVFAIILKLLLQPALRILERLHVPRILAALLLIIALFGTIVGLGAAISGPAGTWAAKLPEGIPRLQERLSFMREPIDTLQRFLQQVEDFGGTGPSPNAAALARGPTLLTRLFTGTRNFASGFFTTMLFLFFLLVSGDIFLHRLVEILPRFSSKRQVVEISQQIESDISAYLVIGLSAELCADPRHCFGRVDLSSRRPVDYRLPLASAASCGALPWISFDRGRDCNADPSGQTVHPQSRPRHHLARLLVLDVGYSGRDPLCAHAGDCQDHLRQCSPAGCIWPLSREVKPSRFRRVGFIKLLTFRIYSAPIVSSLVLISGLSCKTTFNKELWTSSFPLYSMKPNLRNLFMKKLTRDRVVPIISASVS